MIPKQIILVLESKTVEGINNQLCLKINEGWKPYKDLKLYFYGDKEYEKIYVQQVIYKRTWRDYFHTFALYTSRNGLS